MGNLMNTSKKIKITMNGLDAAGKTTMLWKLNYKNVKQYCKNIGFNIESLEYEDFSFTCFDVGGCRKHPKQLKEEYSNTDCFMYVVDCNDKDRIYDALDEFNDALKFEELQNIPILIIANKQDIANSFSAREIAQLFHKENRTILVYPMCSFVDSPQIALDWVRSQCKRDENINK